MPQVHGDRVSKAGMYSFEKIPENGVLIIFKVLDLTL
jgi:hypothetical protein